MPRRRKRINPSLALKLRLHPAVLARFLNKVNVDGRGHWIWMGHTDENGYGQVKIDGRAMWAHRVSYAVFRGRLADGAEVDHRCKCSSCVNPWHLRKRSMPDNRRDVRRISEEPIPI